MSGREVQAGLGFLLLPALGAPNDVAGAIENVAARVDVHATQLLGGVWMDNEKERD